MLTVVGGPPEAEASMDCSCWKKRFGSLKVISKGRGEFFTSRLISLVSSRRPSMFWSPMLTTMAPLISSAYLEASASGFTSLTTTRTDFLYCSSPSTMPVKSFIDDLSLKVDTNTEVVSVEAESQLVAVDGKSRRREEQAAGGDGCEESCGSSPQGCQPYRKSWDRSSSEERSADHRQDPQPSQPQDSHSSIYEQRLTRDPFTDSLVDPLWLEDKQPAPLP